MQEKLISLPEVEAVIGFKKSHIYSLLKQGQFPAPVAIGTNRRWKHSDVQNWIAEKIQQSESRSKKPQQTIASMKKAR